MRRRRADNDNWGWAPLPHRKWPLVIAAFVISIAASVLILTAIKRLLGIS